MQTYVDVLMPLPLDGTFTYKVPQEMTGTIRFGSRIIVPFGQKKYYTALIVNIHFNKPTKFRTKSVATVLEEAPLITQQQYHFWQWLSAYYMCSIGEIYKAALPSGFRLESETILSINEQFSAFDTLTEKEKLVFNCLLNKDEQTAFELEKEIKLPGTILILRNLLNKEAIRTTEKIKYKYKPANELYVKLNKAYNEQDAIKQLLQKLKRAKKQLELLMAYLALSGGLSNTKKEVTRKDLLAKGNSSPAILKALLDKDIFVTYKKEVSRLEVFNKTIQQRQELNPAQTKAIKEIEKNFKTKETVLLHGVTSSGKTELYIDLIEKTITAGHQALLLLPEIALTTQITQRLKVVFGDKLGVYHSKFSNEERVEIWNNLLVKKKYQVILGVRSSIFLPFSDLKLIIVDEEHEQSYKQVAPSPRYHARNAAIMLAHQIKANVLLGTATPSIETYYNTLVGKYGRVTLSQRYKDIKLPHIVAVNMREQRRKKRSVASFSEPLIEEIKKALKTGKQILLFQNRRGFAPMVECTACAWIPKCEHCDVSLTYHKRLNQMTCHYCGAIYPVPTTCPSCQSTALKYKGTGTEKIEDEIQTLFPEVKVARMDTDTTRNKLSHQKIIQAFENKEIDILIGTQMISKGLDFDNVAIVGIINADTLLNYPDFRAFERAFQMMTQVAGRAGRKGDQGLVLLQTNQPDHPVIQQTIQDNYLAMFEAQINERKLFHYPPFYKLISLYMKHKDLNQLSAFANTTADFLKKALGKRVLGPEQPPVGRIQSYYIQKIVLKIEPNISMTKMKAYLESTVKQLKENNQIKSISIYWDVDPM